MLVENPKLVGLEERKKKVDEHMYKGLIAAGVSVAATLVNPVVGFVMTGEVWRQAWKINIIAKQVEEMLPQARDES